MLRTQMYKILKLQFVKKTVFLNILDFQKSMDICLKKTKKIIIY